jgi:hypothetical protein
MDNIVWEDEDMWREASRRAELVREMEEFKKWKYIGDRTIQKIEYKYDGTPVITIRKLGIFEDPVLYMTFNC